MAEHLWGAIFDWDGVIIDSSAQHDESWQRMAKEMKATLPEDYFQRSFGMKNEFIIPELLAWTDDADEIKRISLRKEALYREVVGERGLSALPGVNEWLKRLSAAGIPCAVGSSTHRLNIELALERIHLAEFFADIVSAEDVKKGKPDPEVFLKAAARIGRKPEFCVVFEDAKVGIEAAHAAGMKVVGVATTLPLSGLSKADQAVQRLDELEIGEIDRWFS